MGKLLVLLNGERHDTDLIDQGLQASWIARDLGLGDDGYVALCKAGHAGLCLGTVNEKLKAIKRQGLLHGCRGVYITHERNRRDDKVYHRVRLNICMGGRRIRRELGSYRVK